jgi:hypothetical protein
MANVRTRIVIVFGLVAVTVQMASAHATPGQGDQQWLIDAGPYAQPGWSRDELLAQGDDICDSLMAHGPGSPAAPMNVVVQGVQASFVVQDRAHAVSLVNAAILTLCPNEGPITPVG